MSKIQLNSYILAALLILALAGQKAHRPLAADGPVKTDFSRIPMEIDGWTGTDGRFDEITYRELPSCSLLVRYYFNQNHQMPVDLAIVYGTDLGDFHQPEVCLEGQGLRSIEKKKITVKTKSGPFQAIRLITESDYERRAFVFWFADQGTTSTFLGDYKTKVFLSRLRNKSIKPSALVRLSAAVVGSDNEAVDAILKFIDVSFPYLQEEFEAKPSET